jgi:uncharacterized membrane protein
MRETMLILHFVGLAMGVGAGLAFLFLGINAGKMEPAKRREYLLGAHPIARMGQFGLLLLVITGTGLMTPYWRALGQMPLLIAKLCLVLVLGAIIGINSSLMRKARKDPNVPVTKMATLGRFALLTSLTIVVLAVLVFR